MAEPDEAEIERIARFLAVESGCDSDTVVYLEQPLEIRTPHGIARMYNRSNLLWECYRRTARHIATHKAELLKDNAPQT